MLWKIIRPLGPLALFAAALAFVSPASLVAQIASTLLTTRITQPIDENSRVTLRGSVHPLANRNNDRGAAPDSMPLDRITLFFKRSDAQESALQQLISDLHTPGSASYHQWLTPGEFGKQFGPSDQDLATVQSWLSSHGFSVTKVNAGRQSIEFSGNVAQFRDTFHAQIHKYAVNGETHYANASDPQIPAALATVIGGFASLNNFRVKSYIRRLGEATYDPATGKSKPEWTIGSAQTGYSFVLSPGDYAVQYDLNPLYSAGVDGTGQTIAIVNESNINIYLVNQFRSLFGLPANPPRVIIDGNDPGVDGINNPDGPNYASGEAYLDVEWSGAVAPRATVDLVIGADTAIESGLFLALEHTVYGDVAPVVSISFGYCEAFLGSTNTFLNQLYEQGAAQGQTILVSSGDSGSAGCDDDNTQQYAVNGQQVSGFASTPYNVAVGGTDFYYSAWNQGNNAIFNQLQKYWNLTPSNNNPAVSIKSVIPEQPWNDSQYGLNIIDYYQATGQTTIVGGSGGASNAGICSTNKYDSSGNCTGKLSGYPKPSWQKGTGVPSDGVRDIPDVSLFASNGLNASYYPTCASDGDCQPVSSGGTVQITGVGGTSASAPSFAGIMALVNQKYGPQGQANFVLYPLAKQVPTAFHDVTVGTNSMPCDHSGGSLNCIAVSNPITVGGVTEGQIGKGTTPEYNATAGYGPATGLGSVDANVLVTNWNKITFDATTITLKPSETSFTHGTTINISGSVTGTGTPSGNVALLTDSSEPVQQGQNVAQPLVGNSSTFPLKSGSFSGSVNYLPGGTYNIWGAYSGDGTNAPSNSSKTQITVTPESSSVYFNVLDVGTGYDGTVPIVSGANDVPYGTQLILSAIAAPSSYYKECLATSKPPSSCSTLTYTSPTGTVTFYDHGKVINTAIVNAEGDAEYNGSWSYGSHTVTSRYSGDNSYSESTASTITFFIVKNIPQINASSSIITNSNGLVAGQSTVFTVLVSNTANLATENYYNSVFSNPVAAPTGTVTISGFPSGVPTTATLQAGTDPATSAAVGIGTITIPSTAAAGTYKVRVSYPGDANYVATYQNFTIPIQSVGGLTSAVTASASGAISASTTVTISGSVTGQTGHSAPGNANGGVLFYSAGYNLGQVSLVPGAGDSSTFSAKLSSASLPQGSNTITVQYLGDATYAPSAYTFSTPLSNPLSDFSMAPQTTPVPVYQGASSTDTINVSSANGFAGSVNFTCTATTVTCSVTQTATLSAGSTVPITLTINAGSSAATGSYNVLVTGTDSTGQFVHTLTIQTVVSTAPTFTLSAEESMTVLIGQYTRTYVTVTPSGGFTGTVSLKCALQSRGVSCGMTPPSVTLKGTGAVKSILSVYAISLPVSLDQPFNKLFAVGGGTALALVAFFGIPARRRSWRKLLAVLVFAALVGLDIGCGVTGAKPANFTVTVTGTSGSTTQTATVNVSLVSPKK